MEGTANLHGRTDGSAFFNRNIRVAVLPCSESTSCLFRTRPVEASDNLVYNEVFWVSISYPALRQKTLRVDVCTVDKSHLEECLVSINLYFYIFVFVSSFELGKILNSGVWQFLWKCSWWSLATWSLTGFFAVRILIKKKTKIYSMFCYRTSGDFVRLLDFPSLMTEPETLPIFLHFVNISCKVIENGLLRGIW